jgi:hypothetical protein
MPKGMQVESRLVYLERVSMSQRRFKLKVETVERYSPYDSEPLV